MVEPLGPSPEEPRAGGDYPLVAIVGPTAAGKSALALALAERVGGEIVNYDSVQVYRGFDIGAGKVPPGERRGIPHHLLDCLEPDQVFTAGDYRREASRVVRAIREGGKVPVLVGGTGLYLQALLLGLFEGPQRSEALRARLRGLAERRGRGFLHRLLERLDRKTASRIAPRDTQKIIRAVEVCLLGRQPLSVMVERGRESLRGFRVLRIGVMADRADLYRRINRRVEQMFDEGLVEETRGHLERWAGREAEIKPLAALGYRQACAVLAGDISARDAIREAQAATRRYAKRQITWFRRETDITWFAGFGDEPQIQRRVFAWLDGQIPLVRFQSRKLPG